MIIILTSHIEGMKDIPDIVGLIAGIVKDLGMTIGLENFRRLIGNMSKKSSLENMVDSLEYQMKIDALADKEENSYKGRVI